MEDPGFDSATHYCIFFFVVGFIAVNTVCKTGDVNL